LDKLQVGMKEIQTMDPVAYPEKHDAMRKRNEHISAIMLDLKRTDKKGNIMREAQGLFYDSNFMQRLDSKSHLMCFTNGVVDLKGSILFRDGVPEDYTSKCTNNEYVPVDQCDPAVVEEVKTFMHQLFPVDELYEYMWDHAASALWGKNTNQTFNVYTGVGRNGKSAFVQLMGKALGDYKATVPVTLITQKRTSIGSCSPEIAQLVGVRYAVMQEPSLGDKINEGIMKELTGGDPLQARALYQSPVTFQPQFLLACCTNNNFEIMSTDDGTWRRMRIVDFLSLFCENPVEGDPVKPYQFKVDKNVEGKFEVWKTVFMALLVERAVKTGGNVVDCPFIIARTREYREDQDFFAEYTNACIMADPTKLLKKADNEERFEEWWRKKNKDAKKPNSNYLKRYMDGRFGTLVDCAGVKKSAWQGITLIPEA
jgi:P4 family phage/plasmid primase-like protien